MRVDLIAATAFREVPLGIPWAPHDSEGGAALVEFAGRACYQSWERPNPATATNEGYIAHIIEVAHNSVMEHASVTFYVRDVSRSLTHELVRHRAGWGYSQLSQRFVDESEREAAPVIPPIFDGDSGGEDCIRGWHAAALNVYDNLVEMALNKGATRKQAREAARSVLPNASQTEIVVTANMTALRHFFVMRGSLHADAEIRRLAVRMFSILAATVDMGVFFADFEIRKSEQGEYLAKVNDPEGNGK
jgi:thymidylate synthase (FAD)